MTAAAIVLVCGIPATGKSTICEHVVANKNWKYICFDTLYSGYKEFNSMEWKRKQNEMHDRVKLLLTEGHQDQVILVDDNFYYESMRRVYYQLAKRMGIGFGVVFVKCNLDECLDRNRNRVNLSRVPDQVIVDMDGKFEYDVRPATIHSITVENVGSVSKVDAITKELIRFIERCQREPLVASDEEEMKLQEEITKSKRANDSLLHTLDLALKKKMNSLITSDQYHTVDTVKRKQFIMKCNQIRKEVYQNVKNGTVQVNNHMSDQEFVLTVEQLFESTIATN